MATQGIFSLGEFKLELSNGAWSSDPQYGYYFGGTSPTSPVVSLVQRINFANDLATAFRGSLTKNSTDGSAVTDLINYAYLIGGFDTPSTIPTSIVQRIDYSNDLANSQNRSLATVAKYGGGQFFTANFGWVVGASVEPASPRERSYVDRLSFANDSLYMSIRGPLSSARYKGSSVQNDYYGWFSGGYSIGGGAIRHTRVDRVDFNSDLSITSVRRNDAIGGSFAAGASSKVYGWTIGQRSTSVSQGTSVERMTFANDTAAAVLRGPTLVAKFNHTASYNSSSGWVGGGRDVSPTPNHFSRIDRFNYENDLASFSARANFPATLSTAPATQGQLSRKLVPLNSQFGWCAGGAPGPAPYNSNIERTDFNNDTTLANVRSVLSIGLSGIFGAGNNNYAWWGGGYNPSSINVSNVHRTNYSSDTTNALPRGALTVARHNGDAASTPDYGWYIGGRQPGLNSRVDRIDFANDSPTAISRNTLPKETGNNGVAANANYAYTAGGSNLTSIQRLDLQNDQSAIPSVGNLTQSRRYYRGFGNNSYGYFGGGDQAIPASRSDIDRLDYTNDSPNTIIRGNFSVPIDSFSAAGNNSFGYIYSGTQSAGSPITYTNYSFVQRIDYSTDTSNALVRGALSETKPQSHALSGIIQSTIANPLSVPTTAQYGYNAAGGPAPTVSTVKRIDFNNDTVTVPIRGNLTGGRTYPAGFSNLSHGWTGGGGDYPVPFTGTTKIERLDLQNDDTNSNIRGPLNVVRNGPGAFVSQSYGYFVGGNAGSPPGTHYTTTDRLDLSNDLPTTSSRGNLAAARYLAGYNSTQNYGYLFAGYTTPVVSFLSTTERFDFASDLSAGSLRANFPASFAQQTATGNGSYAWIATPDGNQSTVHRLDYSSDLSSPPTRGPLSLGRRNGAATGNANYGWFVGGAPVHSVVDRIDFANDNAVASTRGNLPTAQRSGAPFAALARKILTPNALPKSGTYGWWGAGRLPASHSRVSRLDYANDLSIANSVGPLVAATGYRAVVGNKDSGWFVGGEGFGSPTQFMSGVDRIDFANDLNNGSARAKLTTGRLHPSGVGNANYGWICGGTFASPDVDTTSVERIDYGSDTVTPLSRGPITKARRHFSGTSNKDFGYNVAGYSNTGFMSTVDRINFSNDLSTASALPNTTSHYGSGVTGNRNYGWWAGGQENTDAHTTLIRRIDFSNDSPGFSSRGTIIIGRRYTNATGNEDYGWWGGGITAASANESRFERLEFANDLSTSSVRGNLSLADYQSNGVTNKSTGH